eukprot:12371731-Alexandrium_andersonii.AAC.1
MTPQRQLSSHLVIAKVRLRRKDAPCTIQACGNHVIAHRKSSVCNLGCARWPSCAKQERRQCTNTGADAGP